MNIYTCNTEEYISVLLALCGELPMDELAPRAPVKEASLYRGIKILKDNRVLIKHRYDDGRRFLRLSSINGERHLASLSNDLVFNAKSIVNSELKYSGAKGPRLRKRIDSEFYYNMLNLGIPINNMMIEHRSRTINSTTSFHTEDTSFFNDSPAPTMEEIARMIPAGYTGLITKKLIKEQREGELSKTGSRTSRMSGVLFLEGNVFKAYALQDPLVSAWKPEAEFRASSYITGAIERGCAYLKEHDLQIENNCMLLFPSSESASRMILTDEKKPQIDPTSIYTKSYVRPSYNLGWMYKKLFGIPEWDRKMSKAFFPDGTEGSTSDLVLHDKTEVYIFVGCDLNKIRYAQPRLLGAGIPSILLIEKWMSPAIKEVYNSKNIEIIEIDDQEIDVIASTIS